MISSPSFIADSAPPFPALTLNCVCGNKWVTFFAKGPEFSLPPVDRLLLLCGPNAIPRLIVSGIVGSLNTQAFRPLAHVLVKILKLVPAITNDDAASSIVRPRSEILISTPIEHRLPSPVNGRSALAVSSMNLTINFPHQATTRLRRIFGANSTSGNHCRGSAIASANPPARFAIERRALDQNQPSDAMARLVIGFLSAAQFISRSIR